MRHRLAVVGLGMASAPHARSLLDLAERVEVAGAYSPTAARREAFAAAHGLPVTDDLDGLLDRATAVLILTPPSTHLDLVRRAAAAGTHILLEKPLETTLARAEALVDAAEAAGVTLGVVLQHRFRPAGRALWELARSGRLGALVMASARLNNWRPQSYYDEPGRGTLARDGGGVLLTQAIHTLDLLVAATDLPAEITGFAATSPVHRMETEDVAVAALRYATGALGVVSATTAAYPGFPDAIDIVGTAGTARLDGATLHVALRDGTHTVEDGTDGHGAGADPMAFSHHHHRAVLADFLDAVEAGRPPLVSGREALKVHRLIAAILHAAETGAAALA